jgi:hypothetical protein
MFNGTVFLPLRVSRDRHPADHLSIFAEMIAEEYNYKIICADKLALSDVVGNVLFTIKAPQISYYDCLEDISALPKHIKYVSYIQDLDGEENREYLQALMAAFTRADVILYSYRDAFCGAYPEYVSKGIFFPAFVIPSERYLGITNEFLGRIRKCLFTGEHFAGYYPLRSKIVTSNRSDLFEIIGHPGYGVDMTPKLGNHSVFIRDRYAKKLSDYTCAITTTFQGGTKTTFNWVVCKYYEIMAAGCVLLANWCPEMDELGFVDGGNYIKIDSDNYLHKVEDVVHNPAKYTDIVACGREFTRQYHTEKQRMEVLRGIL